MVRRASLRASDHDREQVVERLRQAAAEGRLLAEELEHRLATALRARTYAELDPLVADLPGATAAPLIRRPRLTPATVAVGGALVVAAAAMAAVVLAVAAVLITGFFTAWGVWLVIAWWLMRGHRGGRSGRGVQRGPGHAPYLGRGPGYGPPLRRPRGRGVGPGFWV